MLTLGEYAGMTRIGIVLFDAAEGLDFVGPWSGLVGLSVLDEARGATKP